MKIILSVLLIVAMSQAHAQQDPLSSQYFNNPMLINPAFAGANNRLIISAGYRNQWTGIDGSPNTLNLNSHLSLVNNKAGAGILVVSDRAGDFSTTRYAGAFAYRMKIKAGILSFGMQAGFIQYSTNLKNIRVLNADPLFAAYTATRPDIGAGALLQNDRFVIGLSVPQLISNYVNLNGNEMRTLSQNGYIFAMSNHYISERVVFRPSMIVRITQNSPVSADLNLNLTIDALYTAGVFTRNLNTIGLLIQAIFGDVRVGYSFEVPGKNSALAFNTHELTLSMSLATLRFHDRSPTAW